MPKIDQTLGNKQDGDIFVSSHTFRFLSPTQVRSWTSESPWRTAN
jgi:hypothetical protein